MVDIEAMAYEAVKSSWINQKIWNPKWGELPGMTWIHEEPAEDDEAGPSIIPAAVPTNRSSSPDSEQDSQLHENVRARKFFGLPSPDIDGDDMDISMGTDNPTKLTDESAAAKDTVYASPARRNPRIEVQIPSRDRALRNVRSSRIHKSGKTANGAPSFKLQKPTQRKAQSNGSRCFAPQNTDAVKSAPTPLRRSARIKARSGTNKRTVYDTVQPVAPTKRRGNKF